MRAGEYYSVTHYHGSHLLTFKGKLLFFVGQKNGLGIKEYDIQ